MGGEGVRSVWGWLLGITCAVAADWLGDRSGLWWVTALAGGLLGWLLQRAGRAALAGGLAGFLGWLLPLAWQAHHLPIGRAAGVIAGVMGFGTASGWLVLVVTGVFGGLLSLAAAWFGAAVQSMVRQPPA